MYNVPHQLVTDPVFTGIRINNTYKMPRCVPAVMKHYIYKASTEFRETADYSTILFGMQGYR